MAFDPVAAIEVLCWGRRVGVLAPHPSRDYYAFQYYPEFLSSGIELSPCSLPLTNSEPVIAAHLPRETFQGLPAFIADSLPDSFGNTLITAWMQRQGLVKSEITILDRLAYIGARAMGALEFRPAVDRKQIDATILDLKELVEEARSLFSLSSDSFAHDPDRALMQLFQVGTSAGGAKAKAVIGLDPKTETIVSGQLRLPEGYEHWLLKINTSEDPTKDYGRIEYAYSLMARACGITVMPSRLLEIGEQAHFMTKRFDRTGSNTKVHLQTLCAMSELNYNQRATHDYIQLFDTVRTLNMSYDVIDEVFDRMVFNVCAANNDDHTKNHSFMLREGGAWELAPAYDLMHSCMPGNLWTEQHLMGVNGVFKDIGTKQLLEVGERFMVSRPQERIQRVKDTVLSWPEFAKEANLSIQETLRVQKDIENCCGLLK